MFALPEEEGDPESVVLEVALPAGRPGGPPSPLPAPEDDVREEVCEALESGVLEEESEAWLVKEGGGEVVAPLSTPGEALGVKESEAVALCEGKGEREDLPVPEDNRLAV